MPVWAVVVVVIAVVVVIVVVVIVAVVIVVVVVVIAVIVIAVVVDKSTLISTTEIKNALFRLFDCFTHLGAVMVARWLPQSSCEPVDPSSNSSHFLPKLEWQLCNIFEILDGGRNEV